MELWTTLAASSFSVDPSSSTTESSDDDDFDESTAAQECRAKRDKRTKASRIVCFIFQAQAYPTTMTRCVTMAGTHLGFAYLIVWHFVSKTY